MHRKRAHLECLSCKAAKRVFCVSDNQRGRGGGGGQEGSVSRIVAASLFGYVRLDIIEGDTKGWSSGSFIGFSNVDGNEGYI